MARKYELKRRAERQEETHRRITEAAVEMHQEVGPANTTISAIAERAGVQRLTVYRHFPDERTLFAACSAHYSAGHPMPDPGSWTEISDPEERLRTALAETYAYHRSTEPMMSKVLRDAEDYAPASEALAPYRRHWEEARYALVGGWGVEDRRLKTLLSALGHALDFWTWRSLVGDHGLSDEEAVELMVGMMSSSVRGYSELQG